MLRLINTPYARLHLDACDRIGLPAALAAQGREDAAGDALFLARELEQVSAESYDVLTDPMMGRMLVPFDQSLSEGAETYSFDMYTGIGRCEWISNWATVVGTSDAEKVRVTFNARSFGGSYHYSVQDLAAAAFAQTGRSLDREKARMNRRAHEQFLDDLIAVGDTTRGIPGLTNLLSTLGYTEFAGSDGADHPWVAPVTGTWDASTTGPEKVADLQRLIDAPFKNTKLEAFKATRVVLPVSVIDLMNMPYDSTVSPVTVSQVFLGNNPGAEIKYWSRLDTASASSGPRALAYRPSPSTFKFLLSYDFRELPPQAVGYAYQIPTYSRVVGLITVYPLGLAQMDLDS